MFSFCIFLSSFTPLNNIFSIHISLSFQKTMYGANVIIFEGILAFYYAEILKVSSSLFQAYESFFMWVSNPLKASAGPCSQSLLLHYSYRKCLIFKIRRISIIKMHSLVKERSQKTQGRHLLMTTWNISTIYVWTSKCRRERHGTTVWTWYQKQS